MFATTVSGEFKTELISLYNKLEQYTNVRANSRLDKIVCNHFVKGQKKKPIVYTISCNLKQLNNSL